VNFIQFRLCCVNKKKIGSVLAIALGVLLFCLPGFAQLNLGTITGSITDQTGGAIVGATVTVIDVERGISRPLMTDGAGDYSAPSLTPGTYTVRVEAMGFQSENRQGITVQVGQFVRVDVSLKPGEQSQTVTVTGDLPMVDTSSSQLGGVLENLSVEELPVNGRNYQYMLEDRPGIVQFRAGGDDSYSGNGAGTMDNAWMFDGLYDVNFFAGGASIVGAGNIGPDGTSILPIDAIQEVVITEVPKAEFGWKYGAHVNVGLKSGTNSLHGTAFAVGRDTSLDAKNPFLTANLPNAPLAYEQYGASVGGPIKKDKLFFFAAYEGQKYSVGSPRLATEPTTADLGANTTNSIPDAIYDILQNHTAVTPSALSFNLAGCGALVNSVGGVTSGTFNMTQVTALKALTQAQVTAGCSAASSLFGSNGGAATTYVTDFVGSGGSNNGVFKMDWHPNDHNSLNGEFYIGGGPDEIAGAAVEPYWEGSIAVQPKAIRGVWIWTPNSSIVNDARFGYDYDNLPIYDNECQHPNGVPNYAALGFIAGNYPCNGPGTNGVPAYGGFPNVTLNGGFTTLGDIETIQQEQQMWYYAFEDSVSYTRGKHLFKFGGEIRFNTFDGEGSAGGRGTVAFGATSAFGGATPLEDFMAGVPASGEVLVGQQFNTFHFPQYALFAQDDWRVLPTLTLNLGLRWEDTSALTAVGNHEANFVPGLPNDPTGLVQETNGKNVYQNNPLAFAPRIGLAWDVSGKGTTVVRAGFNVMYSTIPSVKSIVSSAGSYLQGIPTGFTFYNTDGTTFAGPGNNDSGAVNLVTASLPWAVNTPVFNAFQTGALQCGDGVYPNFPLIGTPTGGLPAGATGTAEPGPCFLQAINPKLKNPIIYYRTLGVTHAFTNNLSATVNYVGSHGGDSLVTSNINNPTPGIKNGTPTATNPYPSYIEQDRRPYNTEYPFYSQIEYETNLGTENYDGLQASITQRISHGLNFTVAYTLSHNLSSGAGLLQNEPALSYGNSSVDVRNTFTYSMTYNVPGLKSPGQVLEGWRINTTVILQSGFPLGPSDTSSDLLGTGLGDAWTLVGTPTDFDKSLGGPGASVPCWGVLGSGGTSFAGQANCAKVAPGTIPGGGALTAATAAAYDTNLPAKCISAASAETTNPAVVAAGDPNATGLLSLAHYGCYTDGASVIVPPAQGTYGTMAPNALYDKGFHDWNVSFTKTTQFKERYSVDLRIDFFNVLNRTSYAAPSVTLTSPNTFGQAASTPDTSNPVIGNGARKIQLGLKFTF
jgi:hypothetical protein